MFASAEVVRASIWRYAIANKFEYLYLRNYKQRDNQSLLVRTAFYGDDAQQDRQYYLMGSLAELLKNWRYLKGNETIGANSNLFLVRVSI